MKVLTFTTLPMRLSVLDRRLILGRLVQNINLVLRELTYNTSAYFVDFLTCTLMFIQ